MNTTLKFTFEKETKGAVRYQEVGDDGTPAFAPQIGTLYIRKSPLPGRQDSENAHSNHRSRIIPIASPRRGRPTAQRPERVSKLRKQPGC
jgi:protein tyrosine/serine phosphatase